jgi:DNA polymerase elongation subunit (family B)
MVIAQVIDLDITYDRHDAEERIIVIAQEYDGTPLQVEVAGTPHEMYVAIGEEMSEYAVCMLGEELNTYLLQNPHPCKAACCCNNRPILEPCVKQRRAEIKQAVTSSSIVRRFGFSRYEENQRPFARFTFSHAFFSWPARRWVEEIAGDLGADPALSGVYNFQPDPLYSFIDLRNLTSFDWFEVPKKSGRVTFDEIRPVNPPDGAASKKYSYFYVDIETVAKTYIDSESNQSKYPIGVICTSYTSRDGTLEEKKFIWGDPVPGCTTFATELDMLRGFREYFMACDPDWVVGFNSNKFDWPYMIRRAVRVFGYREFAEITRVRGRKIEYELVPTRSGQNGAQIVAKITCPGRIFLDQYPNIRTSMKLDAYKMAYVAKKLKLGSKDDLPYNEIYDHFFGTVEQRQKLADYCMQDVRLCVGIEGKTGLRRRMQAQCKILRLRAKEVQERGLGFQLGMILKAELRANGYVNAPIKSKWEGKKHSKNKTKKHVLDPALAEVDGYEELWDLKMRQEKYPGAYVFEPEVGLEEDCVDTFDFASLYPNMIRTKNICRSTLLQKVNEHPGECNVSPTKQNYTFTTRKRGIIPMIEDKLVAERKRIRGLMKLPEYKDNKDMLAQFDEEQKRCKIACNSLYGLFGSVVTEVSCIAAAYAVTAWGAEYIQKVAAAVVEKFGVVIKYGDTDSIMVKLPGVRDVPEARKKGYEIRNWINSKEETGSRLLDGTLEIEFEDISERSMFLAPKMYLKAKHPANPDDPEHAGETWPQLKKAGIETRASVAYTKEVMNQVLDFGFMKRGSKEEVDAMIVDRFTRLYRGEVPREKLKCSKNLAKPLKEYKSDGAHTIVAKQMLSDGLKVEPGDRVEYYMCNVESKKKSEWAVAMHLAGDYPLKYSFYADQLAKVMARVAFPLMKSSIKHLLNRRWVTKKQPPVPKPAISGALAPAPVRKRPAQDSAGGMTKAMRQTLLVPDAPKPARTVRSKSKKDKDIEDRAKCGVRVGGNGRMTIREFFSKPKE